MAAYRRVYGFGHLGADCPGPGSVPNPYARKADGTHSNKLRQYYGATFLRHIIARLS